MDQSRRAFLRRMGIGLGSGAMLSAIDHLSLTSALAQGTGYRALVCVFLAGGNDGNNAVIPVGTNADEYPLYQAARQAAGLAFTQAQLNATRITPASLGRPFAMHPSMAPLVNMWNNGRLAFVCNVG